MIRPDDLRRPGGWLAACAAAALGGCASQHPSTIMTRPTTAPAVAVAAPTVPPATVGWSDVRVQAIDGRPGTWSQHSWGGVTMPAGRHTLLVHLKANPAPLLESASEPDVLVTFTAEAGHAYVLDGWPIVVHDRTDVRPDGHEYAVDQTTRYTAWEE